MIKSKQEAFNIAYAGLRDQKFRKSYSKKHSICMYRQSGRSNAKCALGHIIPDEVYHGDMEENGAEDLFHMFRKDMEKIFDESLMPTEDDENYDFVTFLGNLQECHDESYTAAAMKQRLAEFAKDNRLTIPEEVTA